MSSEIHIGFFFDGTGEDAYNTIDLQQCNSSKAQLSFEKCALIKKWSKEESSYNNHFTNIFRLFSVYSGDIAIYIEGAGTEGRKKDRPFPDEAFGTGSRGMVAKAKKAISILLTKLVGIKAGYDKMIVDIFGFSRGAATARHFANEIYKGQKNKFSAFYSALDLVKKGVSVEINFIGLFDTVTAEGSFTNIFNVASVSNPDINLYLPRDIANKVFQLKADNEYRKYFSLNSVLPGHQEVGIYGAHSDIGGGYTNSTNSDFDEEQTVQMEPMIITISDTRQTKKLNQAIKVSYENYKVYLKTPSDMYVQNQQWREPDIFLQHEKKNISRGIYFTVMYRKLKKTLELLAGHLMYDVAVSYGVPLYPFSKHEAIPDELQPVYNSYQKQLSALEGNSGSLKMSKEKENWLFHNYIHCSDNWNTSMALFYPNRPCLINSQRTRNIYENRPQKNYPVAMSLTDIKRDTISPLN